MTDCDFSDADLASLGPLPDLRVLMLSGRALGNETINLVVAMAPQLERLHLDRCVVTDEGLKPLESLSHLHTLSLTMAPVTDDALATLTKLTGLKTLMVQGTDLTHSGLTRLQQALPACKAFGGRFDPRRQNVAWILAQGGRVALRTPAGPLPVLAVPDLPDGNFEVHSVALSPGTTLTSEELPQYLFPELTQLDLQDCSLSIREARQLGTLCPFLTQIKLAGTGTDLIDPTVFRSLKVLTRLTVDQQQSAAISERHLQAVLPAGCEIVIVEP